MKVLMIGAGYVGLVTGTCLAEIGHEVICADSDSSKIEKLNNLQCPIYEENLLTYITKNYKLGNLSFTDKFADYVNKVDIIMIAVGTPEGTYGSSDLSAIENVATQLGQSLNQDSYVVIKSTVPVGTSEKVYDIISSGLSKRDDIDQHSITIRMISNPEFLKEGTAVDDFFNPDRIIVGINDKLSMSMMHNLYSTFDNVIFTDIKSAELIKYASNAMLATRISFMNSLAIYCDEVGANIEAVATGIGADKRIGPDFLRAGCGYGGSCFPKDVNSLIFEGLQKDVNLDILMATASINNNMQLWPYDKLIELYEKLPKEKKKTDFKVAVLGLAFKPDTDDVRNATSLHVVSTLVTREFHCNVYDPKARESFATEIKSQSPSILNNITFYNNIESCVTGADAIIVLTEWKDIVDMDIEKLRKLSNTDIFIDGRNIWEPKYVSKYFKDYVSLGRPIVKEC